MASTSEYETWTLDRFKQHPRQAELFPDLPDDELAALAEDLEDNGQKDAVHALPDGTLIAGHQRLRAARRLGWKTLRSQVRHNLAAARADTVVSALIKDNLVRRQLSPMAKARCYLRLAQAERGESTRERPSRRVKEAVARQMNLSPRNLDRYLLVMEAPPEVQAAFDRGEVTLTDAGKAENSANRGRIVWRLRKGEPARKVLAEELRLPPRVLSRAPEHALGRLLGALAHDVPILEGADGALEPDRLLRFLPVLEGAAKLVARMLRLARRRAAEG